MISAVLVRARDAAATVRSPRFWRVVYWLMSRRLAVRLAARICRSTATIDKVGHLFLTGWPHHPGTPWVNLNVSRFVWGVRRRLDGSRPAATRPVREAPVLRVGLLANLASTLTFSPPFFAQIPVDVELAAFDLGGRDRSPGYLADHVERYRCFDAVDTAGIVAAIEAADLDLLLFDVYKADIYRILDGVTVPCIVDVCTTVNLRFHPNVSFHLYCLQQADYLVRDGRLFCATSESRFDKRIVYPGTLLFDRRNLDPAGRRSWRDRDPLVVYHGKLYKLSDSYLDTILTLLADDPELRLVTMGRDAGGELERIAATAARRGVAAQFRHEGEFRVSRNERGEVDDPSWLRLGDLLGRARLAPDPWPLGGASSRIEAYAGGVPVVHMGVRTDPSSWRHPQPAVTADHPGLEIALTTVHTVGEYLETARRALYDETFADAVAAAQAERALALTDGARFWEQVLARYRNWLEERW